MVDHQRGVGMALARQQRGAAEGGGGVVAGIGDEELARATAAPAPRAKLTSSARAPSRRSAWRGAGSAALGLDGDALQPGAVAEETSMTMLV